MSLSMQETHRTDVTQSFEDFERLMEDYFQVIPPDIEYFKIEKCKYWEFDDLNNTMKFHFEDEWYLDEFLDEVMECPLYQKTFDMDPFDGVDRQKLILSFEGKTGGLLG